MISEVPGTIRISPERSGDGCEIIIVISKIECIWINDSGEDASEVNIRTVSGEVETAFYKRDEIDIRDAFVKRITDALVG